MGDVYVYHFLPFSAGDMPVLRPRRAATLAAIEKLGTPIMESQFVVDESEVDADGFLSPAADSDSSAIARLSAQMKSLELRAASRDAEARAMDPRVDGAAIYMLSLESLYLRRQAERLASERAKFLAQEAGDENAGMAFAATSEGGSGALPPYCITSA